LYAVPSALILGRSLGVKSELMAWFSAKTVMRFGNRGPAGCVRVVGITQAKKRLSY
jgi:hypothetical protein